MKLKNSKFECWQDCSLSSVVSRCLRSWLEEELEARGIDSVVYGRHIVKLLLNEEYDSKGEGKEDVLDILKAAVDSSYDVTDLSKFVDELQSRIWTVVKLEDQSDSGISAQDASSEDDEQYSSAFPPLPGKVDDAVTKKNPSSTQWRPPPKADAAPPFIVARLSEERDMEEAVVTRRRPVFLTTNNTLPEPLNLPPDDDKLGLQNLQISFGSEDKGLKDIVDFVLEDDKSEVVSVPEPKRPICTYEKPFILGNFSHSTAFELGNSDVWSLKTGAAEDGWRPRNASWLPTSTNSAFSSFSRTENFTEVKTSSFVPFTFNKQETTFRPIKEKDDDESTPKPGQQYYQYSDNLFAPQFKLFGNSLTDAPPPSPAESEISMELGAEASWWSNGKASPCSMEVGQNFLKNYTEPIWAGRKEEKTNKPCQFFMEGNCTMENCKFEHDLSKIVCRYWLKESCFKGCFCPFKHSLDFDGEKRNAGD